MSTEKPPFPSRVADQFVVRFPDGMRDRIREAADANGRSMNAEIVARLQTSFHHDDLDKQPDLIELTNMVTRLLNSLDDIKSLPRKKESE